MLIFEDSDEGLEAARRANISAIDVRPHLKVEAVGERTPLGQLTPDPNSR